VAPPRRVLGAESAVDHGEVNSVKSISSLP
jgi:hypothetical protein